MIVTDIGYLCVNDRINGRYIHGLTFSPRSKDKAKFAPSLVKLELQRR